MTESKPWWQSKGVWAGIAQIIAGVGGLFGHDLDSGALSDQFYQIALLVTGGFTIHARSVANKKVSLRRQ